MPQCGWLIEDRINATQQKARSRYARRRACRKSWSAFCYLLRRSGHSRQHAMRMMMVMPEMMQLNAH
jgi:hypothetical protein